jgi:hypothetical protein
VLRWTSRPRVLEADQTETTPAAFHFQEKLIHKGGDRATVEIRITSAELIDVTVLAESIGARHDEHRAQREHL